MLRLVALATLLTLCVIAQTPGKNSPQKDSDKGAPTGPLPYTTKSIARGKQFLIVSHAMTRTAREWADATSTARRQADLTDPDAWLHGASPEAIFSAIREGTKDGHALV